VEGIMARFVAVEDFHGNKSIINVDQIVQILRYANIIRISLPDIRVELDAERFQIMVEAGELDPELLEAGGLALPEEEAQEDRE
jgi:hypothetical protein